MCREEKTKQNQNKMNLNLYANAIAESNNNSQTKMINKKINVRLRTWNKRHCPQMECVIDVEFIFYMILLLGKTKENQCVRVLRSKTHVWWFSVEYLRIWRYTYHFSFPVNSKPHITIIELSFKINSRKKIERENRILLF